MSFVSTKYTMSFKKLEVSLELLSYSLNKSLHLFRVLTSYKLYYIGGGSDQKTQKSNLVIFQFRPITQKMFKTLYNILLLTEQPQSYALSMPRRNREIRVNFLFFSTITSSRRSAEKEFSVIPALIRVMNC